MSDPLLDELAGVSYASTGEGGDDPLLMELAGVSSPASQEEDSSLWSGGANLIGDTVGSIGRGLGKGITGMADMASDASFGNPLFSSIASTRDALRNYIGDPETSYTGLFEGGADDLSVPQLPKGAGRTVAEFIGAGFLPGMGGLKGIPASIGAGLGWSAAEEMAPDSNLAKFGLSTLGAFVPGVGMRIGRKVLGPQSLKALEEEGGQAFSKGLGVKSTDIPDNFSPHQTTAEAVGGNTALSTFERELQANAPDVGWDKAAGERAVFRDEALSNVTPSPRQKLLPDVVRDKLSIADDVNKTLVAARDAEEIAANNLYTALDNNTSVIDTVRAKGKVYRWKTASPENESLWQSLGKNKKGIKEDKVWFAKLPDEMTPSFHSFNRKIISEKLGKAKSIAEQKFYGDMRDAFDAPVEAAAKKAGASAQMIAAPKRARENWAKFKETFGEGTVGKVVGEGDTAEVYAINKALSDPGSTKQMIKLSGNPEKMKSLIAESIISKHAINGKFDINKYQNFKKTLQTNGVAAQIPDVLNAIDNELAPVLKDIQSESIVTEAAKSRTKGGPFTAQRLSTPVSRVIKEKTEGPLKYVNPTSKAAIAGGLIWKTHQALGLPGSIVGTLALVGTSMARGHSTKKLGGVLSRMAREPDYAKKVLEATEKLPSWKQKAGATLAKQVPGMLGQAFSKSQQQSPRAPAMPGSLAMNKKETTPVAKIPKELSDAVVQQESGGKADAVSSVGAQGLMQLMPATGKEWHAKLGLSGKYDPFNAKQNRQIGEAYLGWLTDQFKGDVSLALASYNYGIGNIKKLIAKYGRSFDDIKEHLPAETAKYVPAILKRAKLESTILEA